jgi:alpha-galactosidase/6-phospho-beta-glucosidase family protein
LLPLQVLNSGAITNFPDDVFVEVPTRVQGRSVVPSRVGELPDWLGGYTRLLAIQRKLVAEYILCRDVSVLKQALTTLPMFGSVQKLLQLVETMHREFTSND